MATINETIGTTGRDRSTITLWESNNGGGDGLGNDDCTGSCYADSDFDEAVTINFPCLSGVLTVAAGERHDGTAGTGARMVASANARHIQISDTADAYTVQWLEWDWNGKTPGAGIRSAVFGTPVPIIGQMIVHDGAVTSGETIGIGSSVRDAIVHNVILYNLNMTSTGSNIRGIQLDADTDTDIHNCTVYNVGTTGAGAAAGIAMNDLTNGSMRNNIVIGTYDNGGGGGDYETTSYSNATVSHNIASDTSASGTGSLNSKTAATNFVSTTGGSEDLHTKTAADTIDAGTDLGATPAGVAIDINGRDRDTEGDTWDIGAHELVAAGGGTSPKGVFDNPFTGSFGGPV